MSAITVGGDLVHYEVLGRGRAVILVHGWLGSWRYWVPTMQQLSTKYRVYALDLFGFGDSAKNPAKYSVAEQVKLIDEFMGQMGIPKAALIGHGLGAMVLAEYALNNHDKVARMLLTGAPLFDPGDLAARTPAGQRRLLTADPNALSKAAEAESKPASTPLTSNLDVAAPSRPQTVASEPAASEPTHSVPTIPRVSAELRARLDETAARAGAAALAGDAPSVDGGSSPASVPAPVPANAVAAPSPEKPGPASATSAPAASAGLTAPAAATPRSSAPAPATTDTKEHPAVSAEQPAQMTFSNKNPLLAAFESVSMETLLDRCFKPSNPSYEKLKVDIEKSDRSVLKQSVMQFDSGRMLDMLRLLPIPVVVVHGSDDPVIPQPNEDVLHYLSVDKEETLLPFLLTGVRHFPMLEHEPFQRLVLHFLDLPEVHKLEVVPRWVRRTR